MQVSAQSFHLHLLRHNSFRHHPAAKKTGRLLSDPAHICKHLEQDHGLLRLYTQFRRIL